MSTDSIDRILEALLYEGYVLYPYRSDALKNRQRWNFGIVHPEGCNERSRVHTECIALGKDSVLNVELRFLQLQKRQACKLARPVCDPREITPDLLQPVDTVEAAGACYETWEEAVERTSPVHALDAKQLSAGAVNVEVTFGPESIVEPLPEKDGRITAALSRSTDVIRASTQVSAAEVANDLFKFSVSVNNLVRFDKPVSLQNRDNILMRSLLSAHLILKLSGGRFISLLDPPEEYQAAAASCVNDGLWPVLAGEEGTADCMLASPIILYDYPRVAPESVTPFFDGAEIDELLALRILTLTDEEKVRMARADEFTRRILERTASLSEEELLRLHGIVRPAEWEDNPR